MNYIVDIELDKEYIAIDKRKSDSQPLPPTILHISKQQKNHFS